VSLAFDPGIPPLPDGNADDEDAVPVTFVAAAAADDDCGSDDVLSLERAVEEVWL